MCSHISWGPLLNMDDGDGREGEQKGDRGWGELSMVTYGKDLRRGLSMNCAKTGSSSGDTLSFETDSFCLFLWSS